MGAAAFFAPSFAGRAEGVDVVRTAPPSFSGRPVVAVEVVVVDVVVEEDRRDADDTVRGPGLAAAEVDDALGARPIEGGAMGFDVVGAAAGLAAGLSHDEKKSSSWSASGLGAAVVSAVPST